MSWCKWDLLLVDSDGILLVLFLVFSSDIYNHCYCFIRVELVVLEVVDVLDFSSGMSLVGEGSFIGIFCCR